MAMAGSGWFERTLAWACGPALNNCEVAMDYCEFPVPAGLRRHVECAWRLRDDAPSGSPQVVYPDGRCELIVHLAAPMRRQEPGADWQLQSPSLFAAQQTAPVRLAATGALACIGVRLQPAASAALVGARLAQWRDRIVDLDTLDAAFGQQLRQAARRFDDDAGDPALWQVLEHRLLPCEVDPRIEAAIGCLDDARGDVRLPALARLARLSVRGLQIRFLASVGLGIKAYARVLRLQAVVRSLDGGDASLAGMAATTGFADQAHVTRELRRLTGLTPARMARALREQRDDDAALRLAAAFVRGRS
jgi:AraC-like DNA-binding protein